MLRLILFLCFSTGLLGAKSSITNVLVFTADDLGCESVSCFGGLIPDLTPNLDKFASQGMRFAKAHVTNAICQPSRGVLATGLYSYRSGITGFYHTDRPVPTIIETLRDAGYLTGVFGKVEHSTPKAKDMWDVSYDGPELGDGRNPDLYHDRSVAFFARSQAEQKPFYLMVNSHDPHRPWHDGTLTKGQKAPSKTYTPEQVPVPDYLPDLPGVRNELAHYLNSVRRLDDTFGAVMRALDEAGLSESTLVVFFSDNGMAMPFAKANAYYASTRTPLLIRAPGITRPGTVDAENFINEIDFFPTILACLGREIISCDGVSFLPLLRGEKVIGWRDKLFTEIDQKNGVRDPTVPMRSVQTNRFAYIFNAWSNGQFLYRNNNEGDTMPAMEVAAKTDPVIAARVAVYRLRSVEEFYDLTVDPGCLTNLVGDPAHAQTLAQLREAMAEQMRSTQDPLLKAFELRAADPTTRASALNIYPKQVRKSGAPD